MRDPIQANARGAAWIAAVGLGEIAFRDVPGLVGIEEVYLPQAADRAVYDERFAAFVEIHKRMHGCTGGSIARPRRRRRQPRRRPPMTPPGYRRVTRQAAGDAGSPPPG